MRSGLTLLNSVQKLKNSLLSWATIQVKKSVAISCDPRHKESLSDALGLPTSITDSMIEGHMVNLHAVPLSLG